MAKVAVFRPDDERLERSRKMLEERGHEVVADPLLEVEATGSSPREDGDVYVFTSVTGIRYVEPPLEGIVAAVGPKTADALRERGVDVDVVPEDYSSTGLVDALSDRVEGRRVEVARSSHGSDVLLDGLVDAGAYVHETVLYRLVKPDEGGKGTRGALDAGDLDAALFTSSLTVEHLLEEVEPEEVDSILVGVIGEPTKETAVECGVSVDFVAEDETFESLVDGLERHL